MYCILYSDAFPRGSKGKRTANTPDTRNSAPDMYIGTEEVKSAYKAMIGD